MNYDGPSEIFVAALATLIPLAIAGFALFRGEQAYRARATEVVRRRARRAYWCFILVGASFLVFVLTGLSWQAKSPTEQQGLATLLGIGLGVPAAVVALVGLFSALMAWRASWIRYLLLASAILLPLLFSDLFRDPWTSAIAATYAIVTIGLAIRGLRSSGKGPRSDY